jgi:integrase
VIPARLSAVRADLARLHHAPAGLTLKTLQNHKSNLRSALRWLAREKGIPEHGARLTPAWEDLRTQIKDRFVRWRLSSFMRFCSANGLAPAEVDEVVVERFKGYRAQSGRPADDRSGRRLTRAWNSNVGIIQGWPARRLSERAVKPATDLPWKGFPEGLRRDVEQYLEGLTKVRKSRNGRRIRPLKPSTIRARRVELAAAARMAVKTGVAMIKPGGPDSNYWLTFPDHDVKNRVRLEYPLEQCLTRTIDEYVHDFRPTLLHGRNDDWLFPGQHGGVKSNILLSDQITQRIYQATGLRMTVHQFRHAAGALLLQRRPGEYELVRQLLGHRNVQTTINAYIGLENIHASEIFSKIVMEHMDDEWEAAE